MTTKTTTQTTAMITITHQDGSRDVLRDQLEVLYDFNDTMALAIEAWTFEWPENEEPEPRTLRCAYSWEAAVAA